MVNEKKVTVENVADAIYETFMEETSMDIFDENKDVCIKESVKNINQLLKQIKDEVNDCNLMFEVDKIFNKYLNEK